MTESQKSKLYFGAALLVIAFTAGILVWRFANLNAETQRLSETVSRIVETLRQTTAPRPTAVDTSTWKTYRNEEYGFEVKYPAQQWLVQTGNNFVSIYLDRPYSESPAFQITISDQTVANLADKILIEVESDPLQKLISDKTINFTGVTSREIIYTSTAGGNVEYILLNKDGKTFQLLMLDTGEKNKELGLILSTFKFID
jgi:hypothetical protein